MPYSVEPISIDVKEELSRFYSKQILYETKSDIYGCCIKLLTGIQWVKDRWEENFYSMSYNIRSHGRLYVVEDSSREENTILYDPQSKTAFLINLDYYGWVKSLALSVAGDILEDEHDIFSVHGACLDIKGKGISIRTKHLSGMRRSPAGQQIDIIECQE